MRTLLIVVGIIIVILVVGLLFVMVKDRELRKVVISEVDLSRVPDGVYTGSFKSWRMTNEVEVTIKDHKIVAIRNVNQMPDARSQNIVDKATEAILAKQSVKIDVISGASLNTRSFQKAVENALSR